MQVFSGSWFSAELEGPPSGLPSPALVDAKDLGSRSANWVAYFWPDVQDHQSITRLGTIEVSSLSKMSGAYKRIGRGWPDARVGSVEDDAKISFLDFFLKTEHCE